jgi:anti-sigma factor NepR-like protein
MPKPQDTIPRWLGRGLHAQLDEVSHEPLPKRFVELIRYLDEQERGRSDDQKSESERKPDDRLEP